MALTLGVVYFVGPNELSFRDDKATVTILKEIEKGPCMYHVSIIIFVFRD